MNSMNTGESQATESKPIYSGNLTILPNHGKVEVGDKAVRLGPVNMRVLVLLMKNQGQGGQRCGTLTG